MSLADDLEEQAAQLRRQAEAFLKQAEELREAAAKARESEEKWNAAMARLAQDDWAQGISQLTRRKHGDRVDPTMQEHPRPTNQASASRTKHKSPAVEALQNAGWSVRQLAKALKDAGHTVSHTHLTNALNGTKGQLTSEMRQAIQDLTGVKV